MKGAGPERSAQMTRRRGLALVAAGLVGFAPAMMPTSLPAQTATPESQPLVLPPVIVSAPLPQPVPLPRSSIPGAIDTLTGKEVRETYPHVLPDALESRTGVTLQNEQGTPYQPDLNLRGFVASPVTGLPQGISIFRDGVRLNEPTAEEVNFDLIPLDDVELVEVIRGPSVLFGRNTLGAAINIVTRRGEERFELTPELAWGSFGRQEYTLRLSGPVKPFDYYIGVRYSDETGWRQDSDARIGRAFSKIGIRTGGLDATVSYQYSNDRIKQPGSLPASQVNTDPTANFTAGDFFQPTLNMGVINASYAVNEQITIEANGFVRALNSEQFNVNLAGPNSRLLNHSLSTGGRLQASHKGTFFGFDNVLIVGGEYTNNYVTSRTFEEDAEQELVADLKDRQQIWGAYIQNSLTLLRNFAGPRSSLVLTTAGRWDSVNHDITDLLGGPSGGDFTFSRFDPRVGINVNLSDRIGFYASYGEGFRAPAFLELTCAGPGAVCAGLQVGVAQDPPLQPVVAKTYEIGTYLRPFPWLDINASLYRTNVSSEIFAVSPTGTVGVFFQNIGSTRRQGAEFSLRARWERYLEGYLNYAFTQATFQQTVELSTSLPPGTETVPAGSTIPLMPQHRVNFGLAWHPWLWATMSAGTTWVSSQFLRGDDANTQAPLPAYWVTNVGLSARWRGFEAFANIYNALNNRYETYGTFAPDPRLEGSPVVRFLTPAPPINVLAGLRYTF
jgi:outer membrane receptor protein involved in Fe transport